MRRYSRLFDHIFWSIFYYDSGHAADEVRVSSYGIAAHPTIAYVVRLFLRLLKARAARHVEGLK